MRDWGKRQGADWSKDLIKEMTDEDQDREEPEMNDVWWLWITELSSNRGADQLIV